MRTIAYLMAVLWCSSTAHAVMVQWSFDVGGNGHFYEPVATRGAISWEVANQAAIARGGYLVTITSQEENDFVFSLINEDVYWWQSVNLRGPWIGAVQLDGSAEPDGGWTWVTGELFDYTNWDTGQPNEMSGNNENRIYFGNQPTRVPYWNDAPEDFGEVKAYIVEYVPEPGTLALLTLCGLRLLRRHRR